MNNKALKLLLVEDNLTDALWIDRILRESNGSKSNVKHVQKVKDAVDSLNQTDFDAILLDLFLPDSQGIKSLDILQRKAPQLPIVVLTGTNDPTIAVQSLRQGAQDYLVKGEFEGTILNRSIQYAIERQKLEFDTRQQALMKTMLDRIRNSIELNTILETTAREIQQFLHTERVLIYRCESDRSEAITVVSPPLENRKSQWELSQLTAALEVASYDSVLSQSNSRKIIENQRINLLSQISQHEFSPANPGLILPLWLNESDLVYEDLTAPHMDDSFIARESKKLWGVLMVYDSNNSRKWQNWEIDFLQRLIGQVTIAIQQSQLCCLLQTANQKLQQLAILDGLTGIANRRYFDLVLNNEWQRLTREQQPLSLILCDVDYFKAYNDAYGHQKGDLCLQKIALILQKSTRRPADLAARYGGEEFAIILPNTDEKGALYIAQNIQCHLRQKQLPHRQSSVSKFVTCSMGIATTVPTRKESIENLIERADRLLYQAKKVGRDRIATD